jgi:hypothetical protein
VLRPAEKPPREEELVGTVRAWLGLLGDGRIEEACQEIDEPNAFGLRWTPGRLQGALLQAFGPGSRFRREHPEGPRFSPVDGAAGEASPSVVALADGSGYFVEHAVPLNGSYSDLTAQVQFLWRGERLAFVLHDLHVL